MANLKDPRVLAEWSAATAVKPSQLPARRRQRSNMTTSEETASQVEGSVVAHLLDELASLRREVEELRQRLDAMQAAATKRRTPASRTTSKRTTSKRTTATKTPRNPR